MGVLMFRRVRWLSAQHVERSQGARNVSTSVRVSAVSRSRLIVAGGMSGGRMDAE